MPRNLTVIFYTNRTIAEKHGGVGLHEWAGKNRWEKDWILSHELYDLGTYMKLQFLIIRLPAKRSLLNIALKSADLVNQDFGWDGGKFIPVTR